MTAVLVASMLVGMPGAPASAEEPTPGWPQGATSEGPSKKAGSAADRDHTAESPDGVSDVDAPKVPGAAGEQPDLGQAPSGTPEFTDYVSGIREVEIRGSMNPIVDIQPFLGDPNPRSIDWRYIEESERIEFPSDYKWLCDNYGPLRFGRFWSIMHPVYLERGNRRMRLEESGYSVNDVRRCLARARRDPERIPTSVAATIPYRCYPDVPGLLRWGSHDEVAGLMWLTDFSAVNWTVVISDLDRWWNFDGGVVEFIHGMLSGTIDCPLIPNGWVDVSIEEDMTPTRRPTWEPRRLYASPVILLIVIGQK